MKENKGITLIALVITIIVLLILAGVSISAIVGESGIATKAKESKTQTEIEKIKESISLDIAEAQIDGEGNITEVELNKILEEYGTVITEGEKVILKTNKNLEIDITDILPEVEKIEPVDATALNIGDYISNYPVSYVNVGSLGKEYIPTVDYTGWRVLSKKVDSNGNIQIQLISAGVPLSYLYEYGEENVISSIDALTNNFLKIDINTDKKEYYKFFNCGFDIGENSNLKNIFENEITENVRSIIIDDITTLLGENTYEEFINNSEYADLIDIPCQEQEKYAYWLIASADEVYLAKLDNDLNDYVFLSGIGMPYPGQSLLGYENYNGKGYIGQELFCLNKQGLGVRPVITLTSNLKFVPNDNEINSTPTWDIVY